MNPVATARDAAGKVAATAGFVVRHPARTALRLVGAARGTARAVVLGTPGGVAGVVVPPEQPSAAPAPTPAPVPTPPPAAVEEPQPGAPGEDFAHEVSPAGHDDRHGGTAGADLTDWRADLDDGAETITSAGTTGVAPAINPATGLPSHAPGQSG